MSRPRPNGTLPESWIIADENSVMAGRSCDLDEANGSYGPGTKNTLIKVDASNAGDSTVLGVTAQVVSAPMDGANYPDVDVLVTARWGVAGGQNKAFLKMGNGIVFSVPAQFLSLEAQNLLDACQVTASCAPRVLIGSDATPRYTFTPLRSNMAVFPLDQFIVRRLFDMFAPSANFYAAAMQNTSPAPFIIPPFAEAVTVYFRGVPGTVYSLQQDNTTSSGRIDQVTLNADPGIGVLANIPLAAECQSIQIYEGTLLETGLVEPVTIGFDFNVSL